MGLHGARAGMLTNNNNWHVEWRSVRRRQDEGVRMPQLVFHTFGYSEASMLTAKATTYWVNNRKEKTHSTNTCVSVTRFWVAISMENPLYKGYISIKGFSELHSFHHSLVGFLVKHGQ